ncbi:hypothetical protein [Wolbachia endosymbiont of Folsomia candida]|uniref:hypothetical protein n=1 Tax=Wolbachia endosymbiont of Folsomia candida TaxID=169402 RepID=UPI000A62ADBC|nr:hypothetical protein [Wolbachia endosymbiont of Folsomia candida]APR97759.1 hypothetical protein ASM33_00150 [Wolbachia endosymbiont of Folsomia candida]
MHSKVLKCQISSYYDYKIEEHWLITFRNKINNNKNIGKILKDEEVRKQAAPILITHCVNLLLYAVTNKKIDSAHSIIDYVNGDIMECTFSVCSTYFESDKYQRDACRIITFMKEKNVLKDFLKKYLNDQIVEKLSSKNEETNQYLYTDKVIFSALLKKHKIGARKFNFIITCPISLILTLLVSMISLPIVHIIYPDLSILEILTQPLVIFSFCAILSLLFVGIAGSIWMYHAENNIPVEKMQQELDAEQNLQGNASSEDLDAKEQQPSTILKIYLPPETRYSYTSVGDGLARGFVSNMNATSWCW